MPSATPKTKEEEEGEWHDEPQAKLNGASLDKNTAEQEQDDDDDDDYEATRLKNIQDNAALLQELGLTGSTSTSALGAPRTRSAPSSSRKAKRNYHEDSDYEGESGGGRRTTRSSGGGGGKKAKVERPAEGLRRSGRTTAGKRGDVGPAPLPLLTEGARMAEASALQSSGRVPPLKKLRNPSPLGGWDALAQASKNQEQESGYEDEGELPRQPLPKRKTLPGGAEHGTLIFEAANRHFQPNVTPEEMLRGGIFGGTAFRPYLSSAFGPTRKRLDPKKDLEEFPKEWYEGMDTEEELCSERYDARKNRFGVQAGQSLEDWEKAGWIKRQDPRGWWQWYFRFYLGRRTRDDARQIGRWQRACGPAGRFKRSLVQKIAQAKSTWDDEDVSPVVRQTLWHWAYALTEQDYRAYL